MLLCFILFFYTCQNNVGSAIHLWPVSVSERFLLQTWTAGFGTHCEASMPSYLALTKYPDVTNLSRQTHYCMWWENHSGSLSSPGFLSPSTPHSKNFAISGSSFAISRSLARARIRISFVGIHKCTCDAWLVQRLNGQNINHAKSNPIGRLERLVLLELIFVVADNLQLSSCPGCLQIATIWWRGWP